MIPPGLCIKCKGRYFCGPICWILEKHKNRNTAVKGIKEKEFIGSSPPSIFVSWKNYPNISIAPMSPTQVIKDADILDNPERWYGKELEKLIEYREMLVKGIRKAKAFEAKNPSYELMDLQEMAMAENQTEVEVKLEKVPSTELSFSDYAAPTGIGAEMKEFSLQENPKISKKVEDKYYDVSAKATDSVMELYAEGIPVHVLHKLLSSGIFGVKKNRKLVPTRWSITAVDDTVSKNLVEKVKEYSKTDSVEVYHSNYLDNNFYVMLFPSKWCFEQLEAWKPGSAWTMEEKEVKIISDFELYKGRKNYAENVAGAYYAAKLAVAEFLEARKKQAGAIVFREIGQGYSLPVGVWGIRENVRHALKGKPLKFYEVKTALNYLETKLSIPINFWKKQSKILDYLKTQKTLKEFA